MLDLNHCRRRHARLLDVMRQRQLDAVVCAAPHHAYYFSGHRAHWAQHAAFVLFADGRSALIAANQPPQHAAADDLRSYEANRHGTMRQEQPAELAAQSAAVLRERGAKRVAIDAAPGSAMLGLMLDAELSDIEPALWQMRRAKDPDELALMKKAIRCSEAMYARARELIAPGISELEVFNQLHAAAVEVAGEPLSAPLGNDFACGAGGGAPSAQKRAEAGELYVLDLGPAYRGYFADNARVISVDRRPTDLQMKTWQAIVDCFPLIERMARPGLSCRELYESVNDHLQSRLGCGLIHHLGHGVGLQPHEYPHLNPGWDDVLIEGEVFTVEPGVYGESLRGGIRIENDYLVTRDGVMNLLQSPLEMT